MEHSNPTRKTQRVNVLGCTPREMRVHRVTTTIGDCGRRDALVAACRLPKHSLSQRTIPPSLLASESRRFGGPSMRLRSAMYNHHKATITKLTRRMSITVVAGARYASPRRPWGGYATALHCGKCRGWLAVCSCRRTVFGEREIRDSVQPD